MAAKGTIYGINGPIVYIAGDSGFQMNEMVYVGEANLVGEVIGLTSERTTIEVYEETTRSEARRAGHRNRSSCLRHTCPRHYHKYF